MFAWESKMGEKQQKGRISNKKPLKADIKVEKWWQAISLSFL